MTNNPNPLSINPHMFGSQPSPSSQPSPQQRERRVASLEQLVLDLCDRDLRESALLDLSKVAPFLFVLLFLTKKLITCLNQNFDFVIFFFSLGWIVSGLRLKCTFYFEKKKFFFLVGKGCSFFACLLVFILVIQCENSCC